MHYHTSNPYPVIAEAEYHAFVALGVRGLPSTYAEWSSQQRKSVVERDRAGERPVPVPVRLADFKRFCDERGQGYVDQWLLHFAIEHVPRT
jgi:hypothetical protein